VRILSVPFRPTTAQIGKFVILRYDKILFTEHAKPQRRENLAKASSKKSAKSFLAKKSAKLPELSRAAVGPALIETNRITVYHMMHAGVIEVCCCAGCHAVLASLRGAWD
jgi:hypothetical protein